MFYYLHLTRPPPKEASLSQPISITPNIANDLRTEHPSLGPNGIDIYYACVRCFEQIAGSGEPAAKGNALGPMTQPQKLITWTGNSYKEVHVFPPKEALKSSGGRWQLLLCTRAADRGSYVTSIDLSLQDFGAVILPILTAPVRFLVSSRNVRKAREVVTDRKQVRNERVFKLPLSGLWKSPPPFAGPLRVVEHLSYDLDKKVWDSGVGLSHWLATNMFIALNEDSDSNGNIPAVVRNLMHTKGATILELGSGTGLVSIVLAALLSNCAQSHPSRIIATDLPPAMEILEANLSDNRHCYPYIQTNPLVLDWEDEQLPSEIMQNGRGDLDSIIMADVTYNTASFPALIGTLSRLSRLRRDASVGPFVLLAYKERDPDERRLWDMAREIGLHFVEIARVPGIGGMPVEIYSGTFEYGEDKKEQINY